MSPRLRLFLHGAAAAAVGGAVTALMNAIQDPASIAFTGKALHHYAAVAAGGAIVAVLAYFRESPVSTNGVAPNASRQSTEPVPGQH